jgi:hypothetical protein
VEHDLRTGKITYKIKELKWAKHNTI